MDEAACTGTDPEAFFRKPEADAKAVCAGCEVLHICRRYAFENGFMDGVWGGLSEDERKAIRPRPKRPRSGFSRDLPADLTRAG